MTHRTGSKPNNQNQEWKKYDLQKLKKMAKGNTPTPLIADALGRTPQSIYSKASEEGVSLKPTNNRHIIAGRNEPLRYNPSMQKVGT